MASPSSTSLRRPLPTLRPVALAIGMLLLPQASDAQVVVKDNLTGATSTYDWKSLNGACLTAGTYSATSTSSIPGCTGLPYYSGKTQVGGVTGRLPDATGKGALRLTNGDTTYYGSNGTNQTGAVVSNFTFPSGKGIKLTFTTVTYGGNGYSNNSASNPLSGADGITFFLMDGQYAPAIGAYGGSLGYSCSNGKNPADGVPGGYVGVGIDEYGNFSNPGDSTATPKGGSAKPGSIVLRGAGNVNWAWLNANYPNEYPSSQSASARNTAVQDACKSGKTKTSGAAVADYKWLAGSTLASTQPIFNQQFTNMPLRGSAIPITYSLSISQDGLLNLAYSYNGGVKTPVMTDESIPTLNGIGLPDTFRFGFSSGTGGGSNVHEITCFKAEQISQSTSSAGVNAQQSSRVLAGTQVYLAYYHPTNSWGQLNAQNLVVDSATDSVSISSVVNWDANCALTGGYCDATAKTTTAPGSSGRVLLTWNGASGVPFQSANLTTAQKTALNSGDSTTVNHLNYLRGDRSSEVDSVGSGTFRARTSLLGDIMGSSPTWVGPPALSYSGAWSDRLYPAQSMPESGYATFKSNYATRMNVVYVGANDGFLHGFRAGGLDASGAFTTATYANDGREVLGYMPSQVLNTIRSSTTGLDFANTGYSHNAFVDATPGSGDIYYKGAWRTWLVGGLGAGGNASGAIGNKTDTGTGAIYVLDVTDPTAFKESTSAASSLVVTELNSSALTCLVANVSTTTCGTNLGQVYGAPLIRRLHNGQWALIFGNGLNSGSGLAGLFVVTFNATSGAATTRFLSTGYGASKDPYKGSAKNGIAYVSSADLDGDHVTDYVYGGDAFGNIWRFDLTSSDESKWAVSSGPLYSTGGPPVTTRVTVSSVASKTGLPRLMLGFASGQVLSQTLSSAATYATGSHALYGVWDANLSAWNALSTSQFASLSGSSLTIPVTTATLRKQVITDYAVTSGSITGYRTVTSNTVCWQGGTACTGGTSANTDMGWMVSLPGTNEQVVYNPVVAYGLLVVNTVIPPVDLPLTCSTQVASGYTMAVSLETGAAPSTSFFADASNSYAAVNGQVVAGLGLSAVGSPSFLTTNSKTVLVAQRSVADSSGDADGSSSSSSANGGTTSATGSSAIAIPVNPGVAASGKRLSWIRLR